jgi:uncharacterized Zn-binding protein involved in type VI secretion
MVIGVVPHVGRPILLPSRSTVPFGFLPAPLLRDVATCVGPQGVIAEGSSTVIIRDRPAACMGDMTAHGGVITMWYPTVIVGQTVDEDAVFRK